MRPDQLPHPLRHVVDLIVLLPWLQGWRRTQRQRHEAVLRLLVREHLLHRRGRRRELPWRSGCRLLHLLILIGDRMPLCDGLLRRNRFGLLVLARQILLLRDAVHHLVHRDHLLVGEEVDRDLAVHRPHAIVVAPEPQPRHRTLDLALQVHGGVDQLREVVHKLDEVAHAVLGLRQLGELNGAGVEGLHRALAEVLVELVQLRGGEDLHRPALRRLRDDVEEHLTQLHLREHGVLQEDVQEAVPRDVGAIAGQLQQVLEELGRPPSLELDDPRHALRAGFVIASHEGKRVVPLELPEKPVQLFHVAGRHGQGRDEVHHLAVRLRRRHADQAAEAMLQRDQHLRGQALPPAMMRRHGVRPGRGTSPCLTTT
mmetsp:Transcript_66637/g.171531  ORF Transcript_66637/g.171531 Transcript_66637/m.171531 type:complete len:370 (-) Transcript_66637:49-1158(-)